MHTWKAVFIAATALCVLTASPALAAKGGGGGGLLEVLQAQSPGLGCLCLSPQLDMPYIAAGVTELSRIESCPRKV